MSSVAARGADPVPQSQAGDPADPKQEDLPGDAGATDPRQEDLPGDAGGTHPRQEDLPGDPGGMVQFRAQMRRAGALVAEGQLGEAEAAILAALGIRTGDVRAWKLLALVRFRLGRLVEAREAYRAVVEAAPEDFVGRLNLGLIALKLEWFEEAATELGAAVALRPDDQRALGYLGYAQARAGRLGEATESLRRAGQPGLAREVAGSATPAPAGGSTLAGLGGLAVGGGLDAPVASAGSALAAEAFAAAGGGAEGAREPAAPGEPGPVEPVPLTDFALGRLLGAPGGGAQGAAAPVLWAEQGIRRIRVDDEVVVRRGALVAALGGMRAEPVSGRRGSQGRGSESASDLGRTHGAEPSRDPERPEPFLRLRGRGEVWLGGAAGPAGPVTLELEEDVLFVREGEILAFWGELDWESGAVPRTEARLVQLRGTGRLVIDWAPDDTLALRLREPERVSVPASRLRGWIGHVVAQPDSSEARRADPLVACEGEGVLLIARHGQLGEPVHERAEPGDDGAGRPDPRRLAVHR